MQTRDKAERAARAQEFQRVWKEYEFDQAVDQLRERYVKEWADSEPNENKKRDDLYRSVQMVGFLKQHLIQIISDGPMAKIDTKGKPNG